MMKDYVEHTFGSVEKGLKGFTNSDGVVGKHTSREIGETFLCTRDRGTRIRDKEKEGNQTRQCVWRKICNKNNKNIM